MNVAAPVRTGFDEWAVLELMGHRKLAGRVSEATIAGHGFIRLDIPATTERAATQFYSPASVYAITPVDEATARAFAESHLARPVERWELPGLPAVAPGSTESPNDPNEIPF